MKWWRWSSGAGICAAEAFNSDDEDLDDPFHGLSSGTISSLRPEQQIRYLVDGVDESASFDYTMTGESSARKFKCTSRSRSIPYLNRVNMNLTFEEVAEP